MMNTQASHSYLQQFFEDCGFTRYEVAQFDEIGLSNFITEVLMFEKLPTNVKQMRDFVEMHINSTKDVKCGELVFE